MNLFDYAECWIGCGVYFFIFVCGIFYLTESIIISDNQIEQYRTRYHYGTISTVQYLSWGTYDLKLIVNVTTVILNFKKRRCRFFWSYVC